MVYRHFVIKIFDSLLTVTKGNTVITGIFRQDGYLVIRLSEIAGQSNKVEITLSTDPTSAELIDLFGKSVAGQVTVSGRCLILELSAYQTVMVKIV